MCNRLVIIGAGGHGRVIADIALKNGYTEIVFVDDNAQGECLGFPIVGTGAVLDDLNDGTKKFVIAIGNNTVRKRVAEQYSLPWATLIHPSAQIGVQVQIGCGTVVMAGAIINACAKVGNHCIINSGAVVEHDNLLGDYVHISPKAALGGTVTVGECTHIGLAAGIRNNVELCANCTVGVGAVVVKHISEPGVYVGVPVRKTKG